MPANQRVMVRRVTRSSPDSDDTIPGDDSEEFERDDAFLLDTNPEHNFYGAMPNVSHGSTSRCKSFFDALYSYLYAKSYLCPGLLPWVDCGPATEESGIFVIKAVGIMYALIIVFDMFAAYGSPASCTFTAVTMTLLMGCIILILILISRKPQNRMALIYMTPGLPFVPAIAILVNIYLILNLSVLTLVRFTFWMCLGMIVYIKYGIKNSILENEPPMVPPPTPVPPNPLERANLPQISCSTESRPHGDRNIFEGDGGHRFFGSMDAESLLTWHEPTDQPGQSTNNDNAQTSYVQVETRYDTRTNTTSLHTLRRPPWAYPDSAFDWD